jgi:hypothetical protein
MKTNRFLSLLAFICLVPMVSQADVVVYKGAGTLVRGNGVQAKGVPTTLFFVHDFGNLTGQFVLLQTIGGLKTIYTDTSLNYGIAKVKTATGPKIYYTATAGAFTNASNFTNAAYRMGGREAKVNLRAGQPVPSLVPKTLVGTYSFTQGFPLVIDGNFTLTLDVARTQSDNSNNLTQAQSVGRIINFYTSSRGYTNTVPVP